MLKKARKRRWMISVGGLLGVLIIGAGIAASVGTLPWSVEGALPSQRQLREEGFAVWPQDTVEEGLEGCADAEGWRFDADETADRYARDELRYPEPHLRPVDRESSSVHYGITSDGVDLGSIVHLRKYDRCWFVVSVSA